MVATGLFGASPTILGFLGLPIGTKQVVSFFLKGIATWVAAGAGLLVEGVGTVLTSTTEPPLGAHFDAEFALIAHVALVLVPVLLVATAIEAIIRQDLSLLVRAILLRLPAALLLSGVEVEAVVLLMRATDSLSRSVISLAGSPAGSFTQALSNSLTASTGPYGSGFALLIVAGLLAVVSLLLWVELAVRGAAVAIALLFVPLALAGVVFPATTHWARRLAETLFALVLSKLVIACVLSLAVSSIAVPEGSSGFVEGLALLLLAALSPFAVLRLLPMAETGAFAHLDGVGHRALTSARSALGSVPLPSSSEEGGPLSGTTEPSEPPLLPGQHFGGEAFEAEVAQIHHDLLGSLDTAQPDRVDGWSDAEGADDA